MHRRPERQNMELVLYNNHLRRLQTMKPTIDNSAPKPHPFNNRRQKEIDRNNRRIDHENCLLLENIAKTIQKPTIQNTLEAHVHQHAIFKKKLSHTKKRLRAAQIMDDNLRLLDRIQQVPPVYDHIQWEYDEKQRQKILKNMSLYPEKFT